MYAALIGTYTIGTNNANFQTITQAVEALESGGVVGDVIFNIQDGIYEENIVITDILSSSASNKITFQSLNQDSAAVTIKNAIASSNYIFTLDSTDNVELRYLTFEQTHNSSSCLKLDNRNENININNCHFISRNTAIRVDDFVDNLNIADNSTIGGTYGFYDNSYNYSTNVTIENNEWVNQSSSAIYIRYYDSPVIQGNIITVSGSTSTAINLTSVRN